MIHIPKDYTSALVTFSGGQDSTTILAWAKNRFDKVEAISFNYGQKHSVELEQGAKICEMWGIKQTLVDISFLQTICDSALTSQGNVNEKHSRLRDLPASFVPNRNLLLLALSNTYAQKAGINHVITGTCETDYSGYPDCRRLFIDSLEDSLFTACNKSKLGLSTIRALLLKYSQLSINRHDLASFVFNVDEAYALEQNYIASVNYVEFLQEFLNFFNSPDTNVSPIFETRTNVEGKTILVATGETSIFYIYNLFKNTHEFYNQHVKGSDLARDLVILFNTCPRPTTPNVTLNPDNFFIKIHTPLMYLDKANTFALAEQEGALDVVLEHSHTCYNGVRDTRHAWGYGCGQCPACALRAKGYEEYKKSNLDSEK